MTKQLISDVRIVEILNVANVTQIDEVPISYDLEIAHAILNSPEVQNLIKESVHERIP